MTRCRRACAFIVACAAAWPSASASAQTRPPTDPFPEARRAYEAGDFARAAELFRSANEVSPSANKKFNEAQSWRRAGDAPRAADAYAAALELGKLEPEMAETCRRKLAELRAELALVIVDAPAQTRVRVAHIDGAVRQFHLAPGTYDVELVAEGRPPEKHSLSVQAGQVARLGVRPPPEAKQEAPPPLAAREPRRDAAHPQRIAGWVVLGVAAAGGIAAAATGVRFLAVRSDYEDSDYRDLDLEDEALGLRTATNIIAFSSAGLGVLGFVLVMTSPSGEPAAEAPRVTLRARGDGGLAVEMNAAW